MNEKPKQEYGYLLIDTAEKKKLFEPKRDTDERCCELDRGIDVWRTSLAKDFYEGQCSKCVWRRKIDPGEGWEIVPQEVKISKNFEWTRYGINWTRAGLANEDLTVYQSLQLEDEYAGQNIVAFRRRKVQQVDGWVSVKERRPGKPGRYLVYMPPQVGHEQCCSNFDGVIFTANPQPVYWRELPPAPTPPKDPAEVAFEECLNILQDEARDPRLGAAVFRDETVKRYRKMFEAGRRLERNLK